MSLFSKLFLVLLTYLTLSVSCSSYPDLPTTRLSVGSVAPELKASRWVKGETVENLDPDQIYVVEFWATWCGPCRSSIPHLTEMAHKYTNAVFIGMNVWERGEDPEEKVIRFIDKMGDQMNYRVAMDSHDQFMARHWMEAAGAKGIPTAFVVLQGKVAWIGHPMNGLEEVLQASTEGQFDFKEAKALVEKQQQVATEARKVAILFNNYAKATSEDGDLEQAATLARQLEEMDIQNPDMLNAYAWYILTNGKIKHRDLPLAMCLAQKAVDLTKETRADILDTYARALWDSNNRTQAVQYQQKAVATAPSDLGLAVTLDQYLDATRPGGPPLALDTERFGTLAVPVDGFTYVLGGYSDMGFANSIERFAVGSKATETLSYSIRPRRFVSGITHDGKIYLIGGVVRSPDYNGTMTTDLFEEFDPLTGVVRSLPNVPLAVSRTGVAAVNNRLYVIGGKGNEEGARVNSVQVFDFETETWGRGADMPGPREGQAFAAGDKIYVPGGYDGNNALRDFLVYDPIEDSWSELPKLPMKTSAFHGIALDGQLYIFGDYEEHDRTVVFDMNRQEWARLDVGYRPARHAALSQLDDSMFVVGGNVQTAPPYLARIQQFTTTQLAEAPRSEWNSEEGMNTDEDISSP